MTIRMRRIRPALAVATAIGWLAATNAPQAAQWYTEPSLTLQAGWQDNFLRRTTGSDSQNTYIATPRIIVGSQTDNSDVLANAYVTRYNYPGRGELDNTGVGTNATARYDFEQRFGLGLDAGFARSVLLAYQNVDVDASRFADDTTARSTSVTPTLRWSLSQTLELRAAAGYSDVEYSGSRAPFYRNYRVNSPSLTATYIQSEVTRFFATVSDSMLEYTNTDFPATTETQTGRIGMDMRLSERLSLNASFGSRRSTSDTTQLQPVCVVFVGSSCVPGQFVIQPVARTVLNDGRVYSANVTWQYEKGSVSGRATQETVPSGQAASVLSTTFGGTIVHNFSPTVSAQFLVTGSRYRSDADTLVLNANVNYDFFRVEPSLNWRISEPWTANLSYGRSRYNYATFADEVIYNSVFLTLSWKPPRQYVSY
jgi:hypothetical protein